MKMKHLKMVVVDMDGTLLINHEETSQENLDALFKLQQQGVRITIATGRGVEGPVLKGIIEFLQLDKYGGYCVGNNGQELLDVASGELIVGEKIPFSAAYKAIRFGVDHDFQVFGHNNGERLFYIPANVRVARPWIKDSNYNDEKFKKSQSEMDKVGYFICDEKAPEFAVELRKIIKDEAQVYAVNGETIEIVPNGVDKVHGVDEVVKRCKLKTEEVLIFGDGQNDLKMMSKYPSVAMGNAYSEIKTISEYETLSNVENGVAYFINNYIL